MQITLSNRPGSTVAKASMERGETVTAEAGAMIAMSGSIGVTTSTHSRGKGGLVAGVKRLFAGESFFLNHFQNLGSDSGEVYLCTTLAGDMEVLHLRGNRIILEAGSFVCADQGVQLDVGWQGFKNFLSGESLFWLKTSGEGTIVVSSFGTIFPIDVQGEYIVDTGHIVGFEDSLDFSLSKAGSSWIGSFLGGEGIVCKFKGHGRVWCQSHTANGFGHIIGPKLRPR